MFKKLRIKSYNYFLHLKMKSLFRMFLDKQPCNILYCTLQTKSVLFSLPKLKCIKEENYRFYIFEAIKSNSLQLLFYCEKPFEIKFPNDKKLNGSTSKTRYFSDLIFVFFDL